MRHRKTITSLGRKQPARKALLRDLLTSMVLHGKVKTTATKARVLRPAIEKLVTQGRANTLASRRKLHQVLRTERAVQKFLKDIAPRYAQRPGGYTRTVKLGPRKGDGAPIVQIEFIDDGKQKS